MTALPHPFPWASLDAITRDEVAVLAQLGRLLGNADRLERTANALEDIVGAPIRARLHSIEPTASPPHGAEPSLAVALSFGAGASLGGDLGVLIVEVEGALAVELVASALGRPSPALVMPFDAETSAAIAGALAAVLLKAARRVAGGEALRVLAAGLAHDVIARSALPDASAAVYTLFLDPDAFRARLLFSRRWAARAPEPVFDAAALSRLGDVKLTVPVVTSCAWTSARELETLRVGDVWMPGVATVGGGGGGRGGPPAFGHGSRCVVAGRSQLRGLSATLEASGRLVLGNEVEDLTMTDAAAETLLESALDAPVVVRVEVGAVELTAREWASLKPGDVISLQQKLGAPVVLRAGGAELGRGELVDVEGELGVRVLAIAEAR